MMLKINTGLAALALALGLPMTAQAALVVGFMADKSGQGVMDAVFYATPLETALPPAAAETLTVAQEGYVFTPYVAVLRKGGSAKFANRDGREHHVKSFSPTKGFEMRVPAKTEAAQSVLFDKVGEVALVCHFHDSMRGFIYVVDTPYFGKTDKAGNVVLNNLPPGKYQVQAWVPNMLSQPFSQVVQISESGNTQVRFQLDFIPKPSPVPRTVYKASGQ